MGLRFVLGKAGTEKSEYIMEEIKRKSMEDPHGPPIFYLVPDQMTFAQEYALFKDDSFQGSIRTQVASFSRLAWRVLQETGGGTKQLISSIGIQMMLRKIIEEKKGDWKIFQKALEKQGFLNQLEKMIAEFKRYQITPQMLWMQKEEIDQFVHKESVEVGLVNKLNDLYYIYEKLVDALKDQYIDSEDQLQLLASKIKETSFLREAEIYIDGFHQFSPQELHVVETLLKTCKQVTVTLTVDHPESEQISELDLFYQTTETYHALKAIAHEQQITVEDHITLDSLNGYMKDRPYFVHLERYFNTIPAPAYEKEAPIQIAEAVHPRAEVEGVAQEILRLVREEQYRFRDMALFVRATDVYHDLIETIFNDYDIPVFIDEKRTMLNHPLVEFIRSALDVVEGNWRYDAIFRLLKTGFIPQTDSQFPLTDDAIDELENYVLEYGIRYRQQWVGEEKWVFQRFRGFDQAAQTDAEKETEKRMNRYRQQVVQALQPFDENMRKATTVLQRCKVMYTLLEEVKAPERLEQLRHFHDEEGRIEQGREQEQVWNGIVQLFDEIVEMAGDEQMSLTIFRSVLEAGLESLQFAHVPPTIDHVIVGTVGHSRISGMKCSFLLGVNEGLWPLKPPADRMINDREREVLSSYGMRLAETGTRQLLDDWFYMYVAFTSAKDYLWISYSISDEEGESKTPSQLINRIVDLFPKRREHLLLQEPDELLEAERFIATPIKTRAALTAQLARNNRGYPIRPIWWHVLNWYIDHHEKRSTTYAVLQSLYYTNEPSPLTRETVKKIYPKKIKTSVSRLESHYRCSFQHFARYSLRLEERKIYKLDAPNIGQLFHEALKMITEWVQKDHGDYSSLTKKDAKGYAHQAVEYLSPVLQHQILHSSNRYKYIQRKLQEIISRATYVLSEQARRSHFSPIGLELAFGENETLKPLVLQLGGGVELILRGQIDRIDRSIDEEDLYLRIVDYKSSETDLNLVEVYYGLALQMLAYLDVVLSQAEEWLGMKAYPAGVLYFHVHNPMISEKQMMSDEALEKRIFKEYKMKGLLLEEERVIKLMDTSLDYGTSDIIPAGVKKNGGLNKSSKVANHDMFDLLRSHMHHLVKRAGIHMTTGDIQINPFQYKNRNACTYCSFQSVCQFDPTLESNDYHRLKDMKDDDLLALLLQERKEEEK
ncbi:MAG TPA: helicase-exonuclease AddAB subunit AddB [Bacillota bacterium]